DQLALGDAERAQLAEAAYTGCGPRPPKRAPVPAPFLALPGLPAGERPFGLPRPLPPQPPLPAARGALPPPPHPPPPPPPPRPPQIPPAPARTRTTRSRRCSPRTRSWRPATRARAPTGPR